MDNHDYIYSCHATGSLGSEAPRVPAVEVISQQAVSPSRGKSTHKMSEYKGPALSLAYQWTQSR